MTPYLLNPNRQPLLICSRCHRRQPYGEVRRAVELNVDERGMHVIEVKHWEDFWPGQLEASSKQHQVLCKRLKAERVVHTILLGVGGSVYTSLTLCIILTSLALIQKEPINCPQITYSLCALSICAQALSIIIIRTCWMRSGKTSCSQGLCSKAGGSLSPSRSSPIFSLLRVTFPLLFFS